jgi:hypothetical protein
LPQRESNFDAKSASGKIPFSPRGMYHSGIMQAAYTESVQEKISKALADAYYTALAAFLCGLCLTGTIKRFDGPYLAATLCTGAFALFGVFWTQRAVRRLLTAKYTTSDAAKRSARQLVAYCVTFAVTSLTFGSEVMAALHSPDGFYAFSALCWGAASCVWIYCVHRGARRLTTALV